MKRLTHFAVSAFLVTMNSPVHAQLRVGQWNISNWNVTTTTSSRFFAAQTSIFGVYQGRTFAPDLLMIEEITSSTSDTNLLTMLNTAPGSPGDYAKAPFATSPDTANGFFYRTSRVQFLGMTLVSTGSTSTSQPPRNTYRYDVRPVGYPVSSATIACYVSHMKAGTTSTDEPRRGIESGRIRSDAAALDPSWNFLIGGDFNTRNNNDLGIANLTNTTSGIDGRFNDPINSLGAWYSNSNYRYIHTQDQWSDGAGMDDRFDFILLSDGLVDGSGMDYVGHPNIPYSTTTWDDPNHSYRCWGNDGSTYNLPMRITNNAMVGTTIAQALEDSLGNQTGHLPVMLDLKVPPVSHSSTLSLNFGTRFVGQPAAMPVTINNNGNTALWNVAGIANLDYSFVNASQFLAPGGQYSDSAAVGGNLHSISMNTATPGLKTGDVLVVTNDPVNPIITIHCTGYVRTLTVRR